MMVGSFGGHLVIKSGIESFVSFQDCGLERDNSYATIFTFFCVSVCVRRS